MTYKIEWDRPTLGRRKEMAQDIVAEILDEGLSNSSWRDQHPDSYDDLLKLRLDLEGSVLKILERYDV